MLSNDENWPEDVLELDTSGETSPEDKIFIRVMVGRLRRILKWNPGEDEVLFDKSRGPEFVRDILEHFVRWKAFACDSNNLTDTVGVQHLVIYSMAKLCFFYWIMDSEMVAEILRHVYSCDGHFSSMFAQIINSPNRNLMWPLTNPEATEKQHLTMLFFLSHAHRVKLLFEGIRFVDVRLRVPLRVPPTFVAAIYNKPRLLHLLLRHGASLDMRPGVGMVSDDWDLSMLLRHLIRILWSSLGPDFDTWDTAVVSNSVSDVWECLRIVIRAVRQVPMGELNFALMNFNTTGITVSRNSHDLIRTLSVRGILSHLIHRYLEPPELQHLCRCTIREALNKNWNLPLGITSLPLPKSIQIYIDLLKD